MAPELIGRYRVKYELGRGGMATVYRCYDPAFEREVAVKVLPSQFQADASFRARFDREARIIAALEHPAIVPVYDYGHEAGQPFIVMRMMTGGTLADRLATGPLSLEETVRILNELAPALDRAHSRGIVHRDLKPSNILFDADGNPYLSDFGIAYLTDTTTPATNPGLIGTPAYMSPEQVRAELNLDARSDIYALGAMVFHMLTGQMPYVADSPTATALLHLTAPVPSVRAVRPDLPPAIEAFIQKAMAKQRDDRFTSAGSLAAELNALLHAPGQRPPAPTQRPMGGQQATILEPMPYPMATGAGVQPTGSMATPSMAPPPSMTPPPSSATGLPVIPPGPPVTRGGGLVSRLLMVAAGLLLLCVLGGGAVALGAAALSALKNPTPTVAGAAATNTPRPPDATATDEDDPGPTATSRFGIGATVRPTDEEPEATDTPEPTEIPGLILQDDFNDDDSGWEVNGDDTYGQGYDDGVYFIEIREAGYYVWGVAGRSGIRNVDLSVTARPVRGNGTFGVTCHNERDGYYMLGVDAAGFYAIIRVDGDRLTYLTDSQGRWLKSSLIPLGQSEYVVQAVCTSTGDLSLSVNGTLIATEHDNTYTSGDIGLFAYAFDEVPVKVEFDDVLAIEPD